MLNQISWANYFGTVAILLGFYYSIILFVYYKTDILQLFTSKFQTAPLSIETGTQAALNDEQFKMDAESDQTEYLLDEVKALVRQAGYSSSPKEEILFSLQRLLCAARFQKLYQSQYRDAINNLIVDEFQTNCSMHLDERDLQGLWVTK